MSMFQRVDNFVQQHDLITLNNTIIVGLSGGPDSVFLLHYLVDRQKALNLTLIAAHLDHAWRPESQADVAFCKQLAEQLNIQFVSKQIAELELRIKPSGSKEEDARKARRFFFEQVAVTFNADAIALAHHKDDQQETFFIRLLRGTTLTGLTGMWPKRGLYIRPLLCVSKQEIIDWLERHNVTYLTDPTNIILDHLRNRIRHKLLPVIKDIDPRFDTNFDKTIKHLQATELFLQKLTKEAFDTIASVDSLNKRYIVDSKGFLSFDPVMQYRVLVYWLTQEKVPFPVSQAFFDEMIRFFKQPDSKEHEIHQNWSVVKKKQTLYIKRIS